jgi:Ca2+-binding RTX toxin-like protein
MSSEFLVNSYAGQWQNNPDVARLTDGSFIVTWDSFYSEGDSDFYYIAAQRYSAAGTRIGGEMFLDNDIAGNSRHPSITALADGGFAVAWETSLGSILDESDVYTRAFNANGSARGHSVLAHAPNEEDQYAASITATANGGYTLTFTSYGGSEVDHWDDIFMQRFTARGTKAGGNVQVNQFTEMDQHNSRATTLTNGNVLITWESEYAGMLNPSGVHSDAVRGRIYNQAGQALTGEFMVVDDNSGMNDGIGLTDSAVDVTALSGGRFVTTWYETETHDHADTTFEIHAQIYSGGGRKIGNEILVRGGSLSVPDHSAVTELDNGNFVVTWDAFGEETYDFQEVWARVYDNTGHALGAEFKVNPPSGESVQENPEVQALDGGGFVIVYESEYLDGDDDAIAGRIFGQGTDAADIDTMKWTGTYQAYAGNDTITGTTGNDAIYGGDGIDRLAGGNGNDRLDGGTGNDLLTGGNGNDIILGNYGNDIIGGGLGADRIGGGPGNDIYRYASAADSTVSAPDVIAGFETGRDRIDLSRIDASTAQAGNQAFSFIGSAGFSHSAGELRYVGGNLMGDIDGNGAADFLIKIDGAKALVAADLLL